MTCGHKLNYKVYACIDGYEDHLVKDCPYCQIEDLVEQLNSMTNQLDRAGDELKAAHDQYDADTENMTNFLCVHKRYKAALESISKNTCCDTCQEAKKVALSALEG